MIFEKHREGKHNDLRGYFSEREIDLSCEGNFEARVEATHAWAWKKREGKEAEIIIWSSEYRSMADALELRGEEGRDKLR